MDMDMGMYLEFPEMPHNNDAERMVLGASLLDSKALDTAMSILTPEDFYMPLYGKAFQIMIEMMQRNIPVEYLSFSEELKKQGLYDQIGGQAFLAAIMDNLWAPSTTAYNASIIRDKALRRRLIGASDVIRKLSYTSNKETPEILDEAERVLFELTQQGKKGMTDYRYVSEVLPNTLMQVQETHEQRLKGSVPGIATGYQDLDKILQGLCPGSLSIIAGRPSMGKTALALNIAQFCRCNGEEVPVLIFSLEMGAEQLLLRMMAAEAEVSLESIQNDTATQDEVDRLEATIDAYEHRTKSGNLAIDDHSTLTAMEFRAKCRRFKSKHPNLGLVVVDYLQLMAGSGIGKRKDNDNQEIADITRLMKNVARELGVPVLTLSQLSRETERRENKRPRLSDLRDSGAIEQDADIVMLLFREDYYNDMQEMNLNSEVIVNVAKNRNGAVGTVPMTFRRDITRFYSWMPEP